MSTYPNNKDKFNNSTAPKPDVAGQAINEMLQEFIVVGSLGLWVLTKSIFSKWFAISLSVIFGGLYATFQIAAVGDHIIWLQDADSDLFTPERLDWAWDIAVIYHWIFLYCLYLSPIVLFLGIIARSTRTKYQKLFFGYGT